MTSVNTNFGALVALQNLAITNNALEVTQNRISTGFDVANARDNGALFSIAQEQRGRVGTVSSILEGVGRAQSTIDTALSAGTAISDLLNTLEQTATDARGTDLSDTQRQAFATRFNELLGQIDTIVQSAQFNGTNLLNGSRDTSDPVGNPTATPFTVLTTDLSAGDVGEVQEVAGAGDPANANSLLSDLGFTTATGDLTLSVDGDGAGGVAAQNIVVNVGNLIAGNANATLQDLFDAVGSASAAAGANFAVAGSIDPSGAITFDTIGANAAATVDVSAADPSVGFSLGFVDGTAEAASQTGAIVREDGPAPGTTLLSAFGVANGESLTLSTPEESFTITFGATGGVSAVSASGFTLGIDQSADQLVAAINSQFGDDGISATFDNGQFAISGAVVTPAASGATTANADLGFVNGRIPDGATAVSGFDFTSAGLNLDGLDVSTAEGASAAVLAIQSARTQVNDNLATLGSEGVALDVQSTFLSNLRDSVEAGIGQLVDADLARESAELQALQVRQQLGATALSIANQAPSIILSFFG